MSGVWQVIELNWLIQRGALFGWVPVALACGIGGYFALCTEPSLAWLFGLAGVAVCLAIFGWRGTAWTGPLAIAAALVLAGFCLAGLRAHLAAAAAYLGLSGGNVATDRAFVMVAVMLDRRALCLRAVAAIIVLCLRPEALMGPGFQMSFAATVALVAVFGWLRGAQIALGPRWLRPILTVVISSAVAGVATAPVGAAHFNQFAQYGLIANLASVPLMGLLVMPAAVLAACQLPLGLD